MLGAIEESRWPARNAQAGGYRPTKRCGRNWVARQRRRVQKGFDHMRSWGVEERPQKPRGQHRATRRWHSVARKEGAGVQTTRRSPIEPRTPKNKKAYKLLEKSGIINVYYM